MSPRQARGRKRLTRRERERVRQGLAALAGAAGTLAIAAVARYGSETLAWTLASTAVFCFVVWFAEALAIRRRYGSAIRRHSTPLLVVGLATALISGAGYAMVGTQTAWWIGSLVAGLAASGVYAVLPRRPASDSGAGDGIGGAWAAPDGGGGDGGGGF